MHKMRHPITSVLLLLATLALCLGALGALAATPSLVPADRAGSNLAAQATPEAVGVAATPGKVFLPLINHPPESTPTPPGPTHTASPPPSSTHIPSPSPTQEQPPLRFAVIGDYGSGGANEARVAVLVNG